MSFKAKAIGFFKPILEDDLQEEEFRIIPSWFEKTYKMTLSNPIFLRLANDAEWRVSWTKHNDDIVFQEDWKKFAQSCLLKHMDLLIFTYKGGSIFKVSIFDPHHACQINPSIIRTYDTINDVESDDCVEIPNNEVLLKKRKTDTNRNCRTKDSTLTSPKTRLGKRKINLGFAAAQRREIGFPKKRKTDTNRKGRTKDSTSKTTRLDKRKIIVGFDATQQTEQSGTSRGCSKAEAILKQNKKSKGKSKAEATLNRARNFQTKIKNPSFICSLSPSYIQRDNMGIPVMFSKEYLDGYKGDATIGVSEDRAGLVKIMINNRNNQSSMCGGWKSFCKENKLEVGDACVFEKSEWTPVSFKVQIFRARENPEELQAKRPNQGKQQRRPIQNMERGKRKSSEGISRSCPKTVVLEDSESPNIDENKFKLRIKSIHLQSSYPYIPPAFLKKHPRCHGNYVTLQAGENLWPVKVVYYNYNYANRAFGRFYGGWFKFATECKLNVGNIWEFDMIDEENLVFKVSIS